MSSDGMFLGSEVIIISVEDAHKLVSLLEPNKTKMEELQRLGILDILMDLRYAVKRHTFFVPEVDDA